MDTTTTEMCFLKLGLHRGLLHGCRSWTATVYGRTALMMAMVRNVNVPTAETFPTKAFNLHAQHFLLLIYKGHH